MKGQVVKEITVHVDELNNYLHSPRVTLIFSQFFRFRLVSNGTRVSVIIFFSFQLTAGPGIT